MKANTLSPVFYTKHVKTISLLICLLFFAGVSALADEFFPPTFLTAISDQDGKVPLFWFSPHPVISEIAYHGGEMLNGVYVVLPWHENCVAVKMSSQYIPFYFVKSKIYILHQGAPLDTNYKAPFNVTVNQDSGGIPSSGFLDSVTAKATGKDSLSDGEWVEIEHNLLMQDSTFWIVFHWKEDTPISPLVGVDSLSNAGNSFWGKRSFFHFEWQPCYHNLMIRAEIAANYDTTSTTDSFSIYRSTDPNFIIDQNNVITVVPGSEFQYTDSDVTQDTTYFYRVTSFSSQESPGSNLAQATPKRKARLDVDRDELIVQLDSSEQILDDLTLTNTGGLPLRFKIRISMNDKGWIGGSDPFGYTWTDNTRQPQLEFTWVDIMNRGVLIGDSGDDNRDYGFFDLGFSFPFYGNNFDSLRVSSDGWLSFSDVLPCYTDTFNCSFNRHLPWLWGPYDLLSPFWDNLELNDSSSIYFYSNNDSAIISFLNLYYHGHSGGGPYSFQAILTPTGDITFQYLHVPDSLYSATVGIQNQDGTVGLGILYNQKDLHDSLIIKIRPSWVKVDTMEELIQPGENKTLNLTFDPLSYPRGVNHANLLIDGWDKNHPLETLIIPLTLAIDTAIDTTTSVDWTESEKPENITLFQNYPNPFNPVTRIQYRVVGGGRAAVGGPRTVPFYIPPL